ncbi:MAG TPA: hypothetical protein VF516_36515 [Kofleriaceae bacterium]
MRRIAICLALASTGGCTAPSPAATPPAREAAAAPARTDALASVVGVWRGTSLCTVRPSPCNDETVVYYVSGTDRDHLLWVANKIVDGKEVEMGRSECQLVPAEQRVVCRLERGAFLFAIDGNRMHGRLDRLDGTRYRVGEVERVR